MSGVVVNGQLEEIPGLETSNYLEDPKLALKAGEDCRGRQTTWVRGICLHTTKGWPKNPMKDPPIILPGKGPHSRAGRRIGSWWSRDERQAGAQIMIDSDGHTTCHADLQITAAFHAGPVNDVSIGVEIYQGPLGELYEEQLDAVVLFCDWATRRFGIQRQTSCSYIGRTTKRLWQGGKDVVGIYGHRDVSPSRFFGDPGNAPFLWLSRAGYEGFNLDLGFDLMNWRIRQADLNAQYQAGLTIDGVAGPGTLKALQQLDGAPHGMWIKRPGD